MSPRRVLGPLDHVERHGTALGVVAMIGAAVVFLVSWSAGGGLPFGGGPRVAVLLPDAAQLVKGDEARVGGARVGRIDGVRAQTTEDGRVVARVTVRLAAGQDALPVDSTASVSPVNLFGAKALTLVRGRSPRTVPDGGALGLDRARATVDVADVLADVDGGLSARFRAVLNEAGTALAGRGETIARLIPRAAALLPPAERTAATLGAPSTRLGPALIHLDAATGVLDDARGLLPGLLRDGSRTLTALAASGPALEATLERAPPVARIASRALRRTGPVLRDLRTLVDALGPGVDRLPGTVAAAEDVLDETGRTLAPGTGIPSTARAAAGALEDLVALRPGAEDALGDLRAVSAPLERTMRAIGDAEVHCNTGGLMARNLPAAVSGGDRAGAWLTGAFLLDPSTLLSAERQAPDLHLDPYPRADAGGCVSGNQLYRPGRHVGPAPHDDVNLGIRAPADARARAARAGLLDDHEDGGR
jgi:virulence factor Mce-like protein